MVYDILIKNGKIIDGAGNPWYRSDVGIEKGVITSIGVGIGRGEQVIDAEDHIVCPGFIDIHSHSDLPVLIDPMAHSKIRQGVTTEVIGQCGNSAAPMYHDLKEYREAFGRSSVPEDFKFNWTTMDSYMNLLDENGVAVNIAPVVGHGTIRANVMGRENRPPTESELAEMKQLVGESLEQGAWGMSTGLIYPPSVYGDQAEITELNKVVSNNGGIYFSHIRGEGDTLLDAVKEACEIGMEGGTPVQIAHFKASGEPNWGKTRESLALVKKFRDMGVDVTFDQYPYIASSTGLSALLPHWAHEGGAESMLEALKDPVKKAKIKKEIRLFYGWDKVLVAHCKNNPQYNGKYISEVSEMMNVSPFEAYVKLLILEDTQVPSVMFGLTEDDVRRVLKSPYGMIGSDGSAITPKGIWKDMVPHPRLYGTFPRVLGHYVREGVISLPEAVRKMTGAPAQRMGFKKRGLLREGYYADITVFDPEKIKDVATFTDPQRYAAGIPFVIVNGEIVIEESEHTGALPGKALRSN